MERYPSSGASGAFFLDFYALAFLSQIFVFVRIGDVFQFLQTCDERHMTFKNKGLQFNFLTSVAVHQCLVVQIIGW